MVRLGQLTGKLLPRSLSVVPSSAAAQTCVIFSTLATALLCSSILLSLALTPRSFPQTAVKCGVQSRRAEFSSSTLSETHSKILTCSGHRRRVDDRMPTWQRTGATGRVRIFPESFP